MSHLPVILRKMAKWCQEHPVPVLLSFLFTVIGGLVTILAPYCLLPYMPGCSQTQPPPIEDITLPSPSDSNGLFIHLPIASETGAKFSQTLANRLKGNGFNVTPTQMQNSLILEINNLSVERPFADNSGGYLGWKVAVSTKIVVKQAKDSLVFLTKDFRVETAPPTNSPQTAEATALIQLADRISDFMGQQRQKLTSHH